MEKEELKNTIESIFDSFAKQSTKESMDSELYKFINENKIWLNNPDDCNTMIIYKFKQIIGQCIKDFYETDDYKLEIVHTEYGFIERNVKQIVENTEGFCCCADITRHIIKSYIKYLVSKKMPEWNKEWYQPQKTTVEQWFNFIDGLIDLNYGKPQKYLLALKDLLPQKDNSSETGMSS